MGPRPSHIGCMPRTGPTWAKTTIVTVWIWLDFDGKSPLWYPSLWLHFINKKKKIKFLFYKFIYLILSYTLQILISFHRRIWFQYNFIFLYCLIIVILYLARTDARRGGFDIHRGKDNDQNFNSLHSHNSYLNSNMICLLYFFLIKNSFQRGVQLFK